MRAMLFAALLLLNTAAARAQDAPFLLFFEPWSANLNAQAQEVVTNLVARAKAAPDRLIVITGYADPTGSAEANAAISMLRSTLVRDALVEAGIPEARIRRHLGGPVPYLGTSQESRRVEIVFLKP